MRDRPSVQDSLTPWTIAGRCGEAHLEWQHLLPLSIPPDSLTVDHDARHSRLEQAGQALQDVRILAGVLLGIPARRVGPTQRRV